MARSNWGIRFLASFFGAVIGGAGFLSTLLVAPDVLRVIEDRHSALFILASAAISSLLVVAFSLFLFVKWQGEEDQESYWRSRYRISE